VIRSDVTATGGCIHQHIAHKVGSLTARGRTDPARLVSRRGANVLTGCASNVYEKEKQANVVITNDEDLMKSEVSYF